MAFGGYDMRTATVLPLVILFATSTAPLPRRPAAPPSIRDLSWLEGTWRGDIGDRAFETRYTGSDGGQVLSASKYTKDGQPAGFEFERFEEQGDSLVLTPFPEGKSSVSFRLAELDPKARRAVFENLDHDFPTRISYQRVANDRLMILVSGPGEDGNEQVLTYSLRRK
jgi:uncharacterized protein DUF6265